MRLAAIPFLFGALGAAAAEPKVAVTEPIAAVLLAAFAKGGAAGETRTLCIETSEALDFAALESRLARARLGPIPISRCSGVKETDPNPLIGSKIRWTDEAGSPAEWLRLGKVDCPSSSRCEIDIDRPFNGLRYSMERREGGWSVTAVQSRWIR